MPVVIVNVGVPLPLEYVGSVVEDPDAPFGVPGEALMFFDADGRSGLGAWAWTADPLLALQFDGPAAALACWQRQSKLEPLRDDGLANKPLTAFTVEVLNFDEWKNRIA